MTNDQLNARMDKAATSCKTILSDHSKMFSGMSLFSEDLAKLKAQNQKLEARVRNLEQFAEQFRTDTPGDGAIDDPPWEHLHADLSNPSRPTPHGILHPEDCRRAALRGQSRIPADARDYTTPMENEDDLPY